MAAADDERPRPEHPTGRLAPPASGTHGADLDHARRARPDVVRVADKVKGLLRSEP